MGERLRAWAGLISSGYSAPAASVAMWEAAEMLEAQAEQIRLLEERNNNLSWAVDDRQGGA